MDNFIVSARKYRPTTFKSVVGQLSLTTTLKNAIQSNHLAHAYLFCGPRGVGKTTCARIFAKTINCHNLTSDHEACNQCESCVSFNEQRSYNIHELDAASNNGVDDIRNLIDQVRIPPQVGKYSVYIIDEVHMLSQGAFNAFLKTLEEPPAHAIFILATTEKHKIIPTILSRCQIYDFNRISINDTVKHLQHIASEENVKIDVNALNIVAQKSDGGMRDALSIFDQLVSFCGNEITYQGVIDNLNVLDYEYYFKLVENFLSGNVTNSLILFNEILNKGFDAHHFITGLSTHLRDILVSKDAQTIQLLEVGAEIAQRYQKQALNCTTDFLFQALKINNECDLNYRISNNKRLLVELNLIRLCQLTDEKKKSILTGEPLPPIQKINITNNIATDQSANTSTPVRAENQTNNIQAQQLQQPVNSKQNQVIKDELGFVKNNSGTHQPPKISINRPAGISISKSPVNAETNTSTANSANSEKITSMDAVYSEELFIQSWKKFVFEIPEIVTVVSFINNNQPKKIEENVFEITVNNVMQESEIKKLLPQLIQFISKEIQNNKFRFTLRVLEDSELPKNANPEETLKTMLKEYPALNILKNNLNLEID